LLGCRKRAINIKGAPLFDMKRFLSRIEAAHAGMWETHLKGECPQSFSVPPLDEAA
jgi:hypothetical protein